MALNWERYWIQDYLSHSYAYVNGRPPAADITRPLHRDNPQPSPWLLRDSPQPSPWLPAVYELVEAASVQQAASMLPQGKLRAGLEAGASQAIEDILDDWCGTRPHRPWPPGPPWVMPIAVELTQIANGYQAGYLRDELLSIAGQALQKGLASAASEEIPA